MGIPTARVDSGRILVSEGQLNGCSAGHVKLGSCGSRVGSRAPVFFRQMSSFLRRVLLLVAVYRCPVPSTRSLADACVHPYHKGKPACQFPCVCVSMLGGRHTVHEGLATGGTEFPRADSPYTRLFSSVLEPDGGAVVGLLRPSERWRCSPCADVKTSHVVSFPFSGR